MKEKTPALTKWLITICLFLVALLIFLFLFKVVKPSESFQDIVLGLAVGFTLWLSTQTLLIWINNSDKTELDKAIKLIKSFNGEKPKIDKAIKSIESFHKKFNAFTTDTFRQHDGKTNKVLNIVLKKYLSLIKESRDKLDKKFYKELYRNVKEARVSGIALTQFLRSLCEDDNPIIKSLIMNKNVEIKALFADPNSEFVEYRDRIEVKKKNRKCTNNITDNIKIIEKLLEKYEDIPLEEDNRLEIRATKFSINSAITHVIKIADNQKEESLYMGFVFHHDLGNKMPIYRIPTGNDLSKNDLYSCCIDNFEEAFGNLELTESYFLWDSSGARKESLQTD